MSPNQVNLKANFILLRDHCKLEEYYNKLGLRMR